MIEFRKYCLLELSIAIVGEDEPDQALANAISLARQWRASLGGGEDAEAPQWMNLWNAAWYVIMATGPDNELNVRMLTSAISIMEREHEKIRNDNAGDNVGVGLSGMY